MSCFSIPKCQCCASSIFFFLNLDINFTSFCALTCIPLFKGPTSFAPIVEAAVDIVEKSGGQYHVLLIIADGQVGAKTYYFLVFIINHQIIGFIVKVTRSVETETGALSPQEEKTINSIVMARYIHSTFPKF